MPSDDVQWHFRRLKNYECCVLMAFEALAAADAPQAMLSRPADQQHGTALICKMTVRILPSVWEDAPVDQDILDFPLLWAMKNLPERVPKPSLFPGRVFHVLKFGRYATDHQSIARR